MPASLWEDSTRAFSNLIKMKQVPCKKNRLFFYYFLSLATDSQGLWDSMNSKERVYLNDTWLLPECHRRVTLNFPLVFWLQHFRRKLSGRRRLSSWARSCTRPYVAVVVFFLSLPEKHDPNYTEWRLLIELLQSGAPSNVLQIHSGIKVRISRGKKEKKLKWWFEAL